MIKFVWRYLFGEEYDAPKLSATDVINLYKEGLLTFPEARYHLGFSWWDNTTEDERVFETIKQVSTRQRGRAV